MAKLEKEKKQGIRHEVELLNFLQALYYRITGEDVPDDKPIEDAVLELFLQLRADKERLENGLIHIRGHLRRLECECDSYQDYVCPKHGWIIGINLALNEESIDAALAEEEGDSNE